MTDPISARPPLPLPRDDSLEASSIEDASFEAAPFWSTKDGGPTFGEFLDIINPLHHLPIISTIYRAVTGDTIGQGPRMIGGALFGGPIGFLMAGITSAFEEISGGNVAEHVAELFNDITGSGSSESEALEAARKVESSPPPAALAARAVAIPAPSPPPPDAKALNSIAPAAGPQSSGAPELILPADGSRRFAGTYPAFIPAPPRPNAAMVPQPFVNADSRHIADKILAAQRSQVDLLLTSVAEGRIDADRVASKSADSKKKGEADMTMARPTAPHANIRPEGAGAGWYGAAMDRALAKYQALNETAPADVKN